MNIISARMCLLLLFVATAHRAMAMDAWRRPVPTPLPSTGPFPNPSFSHTAVWTGREMVVPGPSGAYSYLPDGGAFEVATVVRSGTDLLISFPSVTNCTYTLWRSETLAEGIWADTGLAALTGTGDALTFTVPSTSPASRYFRVRASH